MQAFSKNSLFLYGYSHKGNGKFVPVHKHHAMKAYKGHRAEAPHTISLHWTKVSCAEENHCP